MLSFVLRLIWLHAKHYFFAAVLYVLLHSVYFSIILILESGNMPYTREHHLSSSFSKQL